MSIRLRVEQAFGIITSAETVDAGLNSSVAALLSTPAARYFVKALPVEHRWAWTQEREFEVATHVQDVGTTLILRIVEQGWDVLVFKALRGHRADYRPQSPDLPHVARLIERVGELPCPDIPLRRAEQRLTAFAGADMLHHFAGDSLLHTDLNPANVLVHGDDARLVDWGWATRGAPWLDAAYWITWLIAAGHTPQSAERWADEVPAWRTAPDEGVTAFAAANANMWATHGGADPDPWTKQLVDASARWRAHRAVPEPGSGDHDG